MHIKIFKFNTGCEEDYMESVINTWFNTNNISYNHSTTLINNSLIIYSIFYNKIHK